MNDKQFYELEAELDKASSKQVPAGSARYHVMHDDEVNHAQNGVWFGSQESAQDFAKAISKTCRGSFSAMHEANCLASYRNGEEC